MKKPALVSWFGFLVVLPLRLGMSELKRSRVRVWLSAALLMSALLVCLAVSAFPQKIDGHQDPELSEVYTKFFAKVWNLMELDDMQRNGWQNHYGPNAPPELAGPFAQSGPKNADNWLMERHFSPSDIERIENAVSQWYTDRQVVFNVWKTAPSDDAMYLKTGQCPVSEAFHQKLDKISLDAGAKLERQLDGGERFHNMIQNCFHRLLLVPGYDSCPFSPPKPRRT